MSAIASFFRCPRRHDPIDDLVSGPTDASKTRHASGEALTNGHSKKTDASKTRDASGEAQTNGDVKKRWRDAANRARTLETGTQDAETLTKRGVVAAFARAATSNLALLHEAREQNILLRKQMEKPVEPVNPRIWAPVSNFVQKNFRETAVVFVGVTMAGAVLPIPVDAGYKLAAALVEKAVLDRARAPLVEVGTTIWNNKTLAVLTVGAIVAGVYYQPQALAFVKGIAWKTVTDVGKQVGKALIPGAALEALDLGFTYGPALAWKGAAACLAKLKCWK